jgi:predicted deacylase
VVHKTIYLEADVQGLWYPRVQRGDQVKKDQLLGTVEDFFGNLIAEYRAVDDARVMYYTQGLAVSKGDALVAYGILNQME